MTQAELARLARITPGYVWRLESGKVAPGIDLVDRLSQSLGTTINDLLPDASSPDTATLLQERARLLFDSLLKTADQPLLLMLCPLLARLAESPTRQR